jgi:hypothetical protein
MAMTIRVTLGTCEQDHINPADGSHRFPAGTVVDFDDETAKRWIRNGFAVEWHGEPGHTVTDEEAAMSEAAIDAEIARLNDLKKARAERASSDSSWSSGVAGLPEDVPVGNTPYVDQAAPHPLAQYNLTPQQVTDLERAGFTRPSQIRKATDADLLEVPGIGVAALAKLRK